MAHTILVSSEYTQRLFLETFMFVGVSSRKKENQVYMWMDEKSNKNPIDEAQKKRYKATMLKRHFPLILYPSVNKDLLRRSSHIDGHELKMK